MKMNNYKLECQDISKFFDNTQILDNINIYAEKNEVIAILGASGSGKTTLFNIIAGIIPSDSGKIFIDGEDFTGKTGRISYMQQDDLLLAWKTVLQNISLPLILKGVKKKDAKKWTEEKLHQFGLADYKNAFPKQISGGMAKRASLLRAYFASSDIMLLDEPFSSLDMSTKISMYEWLKDIIKSLSVSVLLITHDIDEALFLADRIYILRANEQNNSRSVCAEFSVDNTISERFNYKDTIRSKYISDLKEKITECLLK